MAERFDLAFVGDVEEVLGWFLGQELVVKEMGTKKYSGGRHWHISTEHERGVLELTWWPSRREMWVDVRANRTGAWVRGVVDDLVERFR